MAGAGFTTFTDGQVLTAAQVNTYLMQQSVMVFASAAARTSAIAAPSEGMVTYLADNDLIEYYDGAAWQPLLDQDVIAAKGDLIVGTGDDTVAALSVGTNGHVLTADSATATGLKWAAPASTGKVLQVVSALKTDAFTASASTSWADVTGLSVTITPSSTNSKIFVTGNLALMTDTGLGIMYGRLVRGSTAIASGDVVGSRVGATTMGFDDAPFAFQQAASVLDSPATTSATTYKWQYSSAVASGTTVYINRSKNDTNNANHGRVSSSITVMEIEA